MCGVGRPHLERVILDILQLRGISEMEDARLVWAVASQHLAAQHSHPERGSKARPTT
jgi:hypothetical protein